MVLRDRGFTLIELMVVIAIICILSSLTVVGIPAIILRAKQAATRAEIVLLVTHLKQYESDNGSYPPSTPDYSSRALIDALQGDPSGNPPKKNYYSFKAKQIGPDGYLSPLGFLYYYRANDSVRLKTPEMHNCETFDLWTNDGKGNERGINNWE